MKSLPRCEFSFMRVRLSTSDTSVAKKPLPLLVKLNMERTLANCKNVEGPCIKSLLSSIRELSLPVGRSSLLSGKELLAKPGDFAKMYKERPDLSINRQDFHCNSCDLALLDTTERSHSATEKVDGGWNVIQIRSMACKLRTELSARFDIPNLMSN